MRNGISIREGGRKGFTLVELLVVIFIIGVLLTTTTVYVLQFMGSRGLREHGRIFETVFNRARQEAQSKGASHFVVIEDETESTPAQFLIVQDLNRDGVPRDFRSGEPDQIAGRDLLVEEYELSDSIDVRVGTEEDAGPTVKGTDGDGQYWIRFGADGTLDGASVAPEDTRIAYKLNRTWRESPDPPTLQNDRHDFLMMKGSSEKLFFDWEPAVGKIVTSYYSF